MTLSDTRKAAENIIRLLKVRYAHFPIAMTEKGPLTIKFLKDTEDYEIVLDAVPLDMKIYENRELKSVLEKTFFTQESH